MHTQDIQAMGYWRAAAATLPVRVGDVAFNTVEINKKIQAAAAAGADALVLPELCVTGYTCGDLFLHAPLLTAARGALQGICTVTQTVPMAVAVGLPLVLAGQTYNCAAIIAAGRVLGIVPKTFLPGYNEYYEPRWFAAGAGLPVNTVESAALGLEGPAYTVPVGRDLVFHWHGAAFGVEICEDLWAPLPPSTFLALGGAQVILNLSASNETIAKRAYRRQLVCQQSARLVCGYVYASAGRQESTTDLVFSGHLLAAENGTLLCENEEQLASDGLLVQDIDIDRLAADRRRLTSFRDTARVYGAMQPVRTVTAGQDAPSASDGTLYPVWRLPFVPAARQDRLQRCADIFAMQAAGLQKRLEVTGRAPVIAVSGGLDSTLALLVCVETARRMGRPADWVHGITMPCFGTTGRTYQNSLQLMRTLGVTAKEIPIAAAVRQHFADIGHDEAVTDLTYENAQARERTQVLMDYAGSVGGLAVGTGDLSELALGWCTYNADHMSMYGVNASVPKTLVRWMIDSVIQHEVFPDSTAVLQDILDTPISPELLPPSADGGIAQQTEALVGPYELHDFFLYHMLRFGLTPTRIYSLARRAFAGVFDDDTILHWLRSFYKRFFSQQFKRSCLPDGVKVGSVCLSPRGDWRMPSDASAALWLAEAEALTAE